MKGIKRVLEEVIAPFGLSLSGEQADKFCKYNALLLEWNQKMNLTAITEPREVAIKHFADSLSLLPYLQLENQPKVIDIGTGAGFPGIPLAIMQPNIKLTLLDSLNKRLTFLKVVTKELSIPCTFIHSRAEEGGKDNTLREQFDYALSRAVAPLNILAEYCLPYVKKGGQFIAMKGPNAIQEIKDSEKAIAALGGKIKQTETFKIGAENTRTLVIMEKIKHTPPLYPRHGSKIAKNPL